MPNTGESFQQAEINLDVALNKFHSSVNKFGEDWLKNMRDHPEMFSPEMYEDEWWEQLNAFVDTR